MIIVSQDKAEIVNFENVVTMRLGYNGKHIVRAENKDKVCELGEYATEKRAKEVLQEIIKAYIESKKAQEATSMFGFSIIPRNTYYEMPKE